MRKLVPGFLFSLIGLVSTAQKVDSIFFHLYTDSLKKGTYNYINVDGKLSNGKWKPLTAKEIYFSASYGRFEGNELILPDTCRVDKITITAKLKTEPTLKKEITLWIKKKNDEELLPTKEEVLHPKKSKQKTKN